MAGITTYTATGIVHGQNYWFRVTAYNSAGESAYVSDGPLNCIWIPTAPSGLAPTCGSVANTIVLNWQDNSGDEYGFKIYKSTDGITFNYLDSVLAGITTYTATGIMPVQYYWFRVTAYYNSAGESAYVETAPLGCYSGGGGGLCGDSISGDPWRYLFKDARTGDILCN